MPITNPTALAAAAAAVGPLGPTLTEQSFDVTLGSSFPNAPGVRLYVRNTTGGALGVDFVADFNGAEAKLIDGAVAANQVPANGVKVFGPFKPELFNAHDTNAPTKNGQILCKGGGTIGQLKCSPYVDTPV